MARRTFQESISTTGIRTPIGVKVFGPELEKIGDIAAQIETTLGGVRGTRNVFAERVTHGYYVDFTVKRDQIARYGLSVQDVEMAIESSVGGANVTTTIEGRERYPVNVRYQRDYRGDIETVRRTLISTPGGAQIPMGEVADIKAATGPMVLRTEQAQLLAYVYVDVGGRDIGSYSMRRRRPSPSQSPCRRATRSSGAASTSTCSAPASGSSSSFRSRSRS